MEVVSSGRVLQGADSGHSAGTTIEAGLPNITGSVTGVRGNTSSFGLNGAINKVDVGRYAYSGYNTSGNSGRFDIEFDASNSNSIYGNSTTVQPPAYVVNIFRRTA